MLSITKGHYINVWLQDQWTVEAASVLQCLYKVYRTVVNHSQDSDLSFLTSVSTWILPTAPYFM